MGKIIIKPEFKTINGKIGDTINVNLIYQTNGFLDNVDLTLPILIYYGNNELDLTLDKNTIQGNTGFKVQGVFNNLSEPTGGDGINETNRIGIILLDDIPINNTGELLFTIPITIKENFDGTIINFEVNSNSFEVETIPLAITKNNEITVSENFTLPNGTKNLTLKGDKNYQGIGNNLNNKIIGNNGKNRLKGLGGNDTLIGNDGNDILDGGIGNDRMIGGNGNDTYIIDNRKDTIIETKNGGIDTIKTNLNNYTLKNNIEKLVLTGKNDLNGTGNNLNNTIIGNKGNNKLTGNNGNDTLIGKEGKDILTGGKGKDKFTYNKPEEGGDIITDFQPNIDVIRLKQKGFNSLEKGVLDEDKIVFGTTVTDKNDRIIYDRSTGELFFDPDGSGIKQSILIATLTTKPDLTANDINIF